MHTHMPYRARRAKLIEQMRAKGGGVAVIATAPEVTRNNDADYPYRHDSYFYYLTGFMEPESVLVLVVKGDGKSQSILFCREKNMEREIWDGFRYGPEAARESFGFDLAYPIAALDAEMGKLLANAPTLFYALGSNATFEARVQGWLHVMPRQTRLGVTRPNATCDIFSLINEMRLFKDAGEIALMQRAADISAGAHRLAMQMTKPGMREYQVEAKLLYEFRRHGSQFPAYTSIVASGANACVLHYNSNNAECKDGDLLLIDAGCEFDSYASDITRSYPVNGRFTAPQQALYELVLDAQNAALALAQPGKRYIEGHDAAVRVLAQGMLDLGLLDADKVGTLDDVIAQKSYQQFYMHGTGHWIGMDVHDVGNYRELGGESGAPDDQEKPYRRLQAGMAITVEPGIYVRPAEGVPEQFWNIGIRVEDDVIITDDGHHILSSAAPKSVADIMALMRS
ncbi:MAG: aminopeptidase P N-terminal domain-containing protein [Pseudomonadota bacterium]